MKPEEQAARSYERAVEHERIAGDSYGYSDIRAAFLAGVKWAREQECPVCKMPPQVYGCDDLCGNPGRDE